jgi:hypothetical protein
VPLGLQLVEAIVKTGAQIKIYPQVAHFGQSATYPASKQKPAQGVVNHSAVVLYVPSYSRRGENQVYIHEGNERRLVAQPYWLTLGHELIHALRLANGDAWDGSTLKKSIKRADGFDDLDEYEVIAGEAPFTENKLRAAAHPPMPPRADHKGGNVIVSDMKVRPQNKTTADILGLEK